MLKLWGHGDSDMRQCSEGVMQSSPTVPHPLLTRLVQPLLENRHDPTVMVGSKVHQHVSPAAAEENGGLKCWNRRQIA